MLKEALNNPHHSPHETALALLSFFAHEFPLGLGESGSGNHSHSHNSGQAKLLDMFPLLMERVYGPIIFHHLASGRERELLSSAGAGAGELKKEDLELCDCAWLMYHRAWRGTSNSSSQSSAAQSNASAGSMASGRSLGVGSTGNSNRNTSTLRNSHSHSSINANANLRESDPVVQLLSGASSSKTLSFFQILNGNSLYSDDDRDRNELMVVQAATILFPFLELPRSVQRSLVESAYHETMAQGQGSQQQQQQSVPLEISHAQSNRNAHALLQTFTKVNRKEVMQSVRNVMAVVNHNQDDPHGRHGHGHAYSPHDIRSPMGMGSMNMNIRSMNRNMNVNMGLMGSPRFGMSAGVGVGGTPTMMTMTPTKTPTASSPGVNSPGGDKLAEIDALEAMQQSVQLQLSLWEYYCMVFIRFALVLGKQSKATGSTSTGYRPSRSGTIGHGEKVYYHLLGSYLAYYFPHQFGSAGDEDENMQNQEGGKKEYFLRLMMSYWLDGKQTYATTDNALHHMLDSDQNRNRNANNNSHSMGLDSSWELAGLLPVAESVWTITGTSTNTNTAVGKVQQSYFPSPKPVRRVLTKMVEHFVSDPALARNCKSSKSSAIKGAAAVVTAAAQDENVWPLPAMHTILQPSLFNYIRNTLRYGPVHVSNSSFYGGVDLWLCYLEPWNVVQRKRTSGATMQAKELFHNVTHLAANATTSTPVRNNGSESGSGGSKHKKSRHQYYTVNTTPKVNTPSKYTPAWEAYVAANLHLYIVPLAIFLRRTREFEFSGKDFVKSMHVLRRVIRVFSPALCKTLEGLLGHGNGNGGASAIGDIESLKKMVQLHEENLGQYSPRRNEKWSLQNLQEEMHSLLEAIVGNHQKKLGEQDVFERFASRIEGVFGEGIQAEKVAIDKLIASARVIVKFPKEYEVIPGMNSSRVRFFGLFGSASNGSAAASSGGQIGANSNAASDKYSPDREQSGFITDKGRSQLLHGARLCNAMDVNFLGDPMYARPKSYEVKALVKWCLRLSNALNVYFGIHVVDGHGKRECRLYGEESKGNVNAAQLAKEGEEMKRVGLFRFNLRFIADTRNWIFFFFAWKIFRRLVIG